LWLTDVCPGAGQHGPAGDYERLTTKSDPDRERYNIVQGTDVGLDRGGWGKILMKVYVEK